MSRLSLTAKTVPPRALSATSEARTETRGDMVASFHRPVRGTRQEARHSRRSTKEPTSASISALEPPCVRCAVSTGRSAIDGGLVPEVTVAAARALSEWLAAGAPYSRRRAARRKKKTPGRGAAGGAGRSDSQSSKNVDTACEPIRPVPAETHRTDAPGQFIEL